MSDHNSNPCPLSKMQSNLYRRARRLSKNTADAEDLVQDTMLRILTKQRQGCEIENLPAYAMRTLHNQARMLWRKAPPPEELEDDCAAVDPVAMDRLECADTLRMIAKLPEDQAALLNLVSDGETSPAVLACKTGLPVGTVMSRLSRARAKLRKNLGIWPHDG